MNRIFQKVPSVQKMKMTAADPNGPERRGFRVCAPLDTQNRRMIICHAGVTKKERSDLSWRVVKVNYLHELTIGFHLHELMKRQGRHFLGFLVAIGFSFSSSRLTTVFAAETASSLNLAFKEIV